MLYYGSVLCEGVWGVSFDLCTLCGVLFGVICERGLILCGVLCVCGVILWCVCCVGSCVWGNLPRVSYMVPRVWGECFPVGAFCNFFASRLFLIFFPLIYFEITFIPLFYPHFGTVFVITGGVYVQFS